MASVTELGRNRAADRLQDDRLRAAVKRVLRSSGHAALSELTCHAAGGVVTVSGFVPTYYLKQVAQAGVQQLRGSARREKSGGGWVVENVSLPAHWQRVF